MKETWLYRAVVVSRAGINHGRWLRDLDRVTRDLHGRDVQLRVLGEGGGFSMYVERKPARSERGKGSARSQDLAIPSGVRGAPWPWESTPPRWFKKNRRIKE